MFQTVTRLSLSYNAKNYSQNTAISQYPVKNRDFKQNQPITEPNLSPIVHISVTSISKHQTFEDLMIMNAELECHSITERIHETLI